MRDIERLDRITRRARLVYRIRHAVEGVILVGIAAAAVSFLTMLVVGLGYVGPVVWRSVLAGSIGGLILGAFIGLVRPLADAELLRRVDSDHGLGNGLAAAREFLTEECSTEGDLRRAHIRQALARAEGLPFYRVLAYDLGPHVRILGILCACIVSVAFI